MAWEDFCRPLPRPPWILMENPWKIHGKSMENRWEIHGKSMENPRIRFDTKWHHNWPNQLLTARISIQIPVRVFFSFKKKSDLGFLGQKRRIGDKLQVLKSRKMILVVFWRFSCLNMKNSKHIDAYDFSDAPHPPQTIQTCYDNRKIGFSTWEVELEFRLFVPPGQ